MGMFDVFVGGELKCEHCGMVMPENFYPNMQTKICDDPDWNHYGVGDFVPIFFNGIEGWGYYVLSEIIRTAKPGNGIG